MQPKVTAVYAIVNTINGRRYIGSTTCLSARRYAHLYGLRSGIHPNVALQAAWTKYGEEHFKFDVLLSGIEKGSLVAEEQRIINESLIAGERIYNIRKEASSNLGFTHSDESKRKMSESSRGKKRGPHTPERIRNMSNALKGRKSPQEGVPLSEARKTALRLSKLGKKIGPMPEGVKAKISNSRIGIAPYNKGLKWAEEGRVLSDETRSKLGSYQRAKTHCPQGHAYDSGNTYIAKNGQRQCLACCAARMKKVRARRRRDASEVKLDKHMPPNIAMADAFMAIFGFRRER